MRPCKSHNMRWVAFLCGRNFCAKRRMENKYLNDTTANRLLKPEALFRIDAMITSKGYTKNNTVYKWQTWKPSHLVLVLSKLNGSPSRRKHCQNRHTIWRVGVMDAARSFFLKMLAKKQKVVALLLWVRKSNVAKLETGSPDKTYEDFICVEWYSILILLTLHQPCQKILYCMSTVYVCNTFTVLTKSQCHVQQACIEQEDKNKLAAPITDQGARLSRKENLMRSLAESLEASGVCPFSLQDL